MSEAELTAPSEEELAAGARLILGSVLRDIAKRANTGPLGEGDLATLRVAADILSARPLDWDELEDETIGTERSTAGVAQ